MSAVKTCIPLLLATVAALAVSAQDAPPAPGPLVEAGIKSPEGAKHTGYMLSYKDGALALRPLDGSADQTIQAAELASLRFLPGPAAPAAQEQQQPTASASLAPPPGPAVEPSKSIDPPDEGRHILPHVRAKLDKLRELGEMDCLKKLTEKERLSYLLLNRLPAFKMSPLESSEYDGLRSKMGLLSVKQYQWIRDGTMAAVSKDGVERFLERHRQFFYEAPSLEEARKRLLGIFYANRIRENDAAEPWAKVLDKLGEETDKIKNAEVRKEVKANSKDILLDFLAQGLRAERERFEKAPDRERPMERERPAAKTGTVERF